MAGFGKTVNNLSSDIVKLLNDSKLHPTILNLILTPILTEIRAQEAFAISQEEKEDSNTPVDHSGMECVTMTRAEMEKKKEARKLQKTFQSDESKVEQNIVERQVSKKNG